jgi:hypothetical protein
MSFVKKFGEFHTNTNIDEASDREENYMFFANLETIKRHAEMLLELNPSQVDGILKDGHDWAQDHIATSKDDIEEVCNFFQNETKEKGTGIVPENKNLDEASVQIAGKEKPSGAKVLATVLVEFMENNKMLDSNFTKAAHGGKNQKYMIQELTTFIMNNTF